MIAFLDVSMFEPGGLEGMPQDKDMKVGASVLALARAMDMVGSRHTPPC